MRAGSRWVDPAPLEVARPRLPWWTMLPGKVKLVLLPVVLVGLLVWALAHLARLVWYYPVTVVLALVAAVLYRAGGHWWLGGVALALALGGFIWWWRDTDSFHRRIRWARTEYRRTALYAYQWRTVMRLANLTGTAKGKEHLPKLKRTRSEGWRDLVRVRLIKGQAPEHWEAHASGLAHSFRANSCRVRVVKPGTVELDFIHSDPLAAVLPVPELATDESSVDLRKVTIGRTETGKPWRLKLLGGQLLGVGVQGAGKGSLLWAVLWKIAPLIRSGLVKVYGIDPKGGMELGQAPELFDQVAYDNGEKAVALLESMAVEVRERAARFRGIRRFWTPASGEPFVLLVVDELADVIAYQTDKRLKERAQAALQTITSQGRAPGFGVLALVQDPRKEIVPFRNLFTTRIAMRLDEAAQVDMVLGDGVRARGANAHEIPESTPGVAWVKEDGRRHPVRARAFYPTDTNLIELRHYVSDTSATVLPFPDNTSATDGGSAA
ncbi:FtsK/SpoIIIE domain-containing protein [Actinokineospora xionganensis]|uniref:Cell division protein FtsK n=1 Tax=Actinokineospora xionganensis TaxID=2684470 RepID=A0ABR7LGB6_9PSEU|nr:FtsK/SpoIIIE domain-containing protein [Actinokineospora xionganensis]MBC6451704.1 cell division protein FtsK [Actinokineospora xionganensis]